MTEEHAHERGLRVLCLDSGGLRGLVPLAVLQNLKTRTGKEPHELFDLVCGTSTGGILAILLGLLKVPVDECVELYEKLGKEVFEVGWLSKVKDLVTNRARYSSEALERCIKDTIRERVRALNLKPSGKPAEPGHDPDLLLSDVPPNPDPSSPTPRVFVVARRGQGIFLFRSYRDTIDAGAAGTSDACVWQAARATSATPGFFEPMEIGRHRYVDGGLGHNNPALDALVEYEHIDAWSGRPIACIVSLGTGIKTIKTVDQVCSQPSCPG